VQGRRLVKAVWQGQIHDANSKSHMSIVPTGEENRHHKFLDGTQTVHRRNPTEINLKVTYVSPQGEFTAYLKILRKKKFVHL
jgi:hypothetical protein